MNLTVAQAIKRGADEADVDIRVYEDYVGRGAYGRGTTALVFESYRDLVVAAFVAGNVSERALDDGDTIREALTALQFDNLGRSYIAY